MPHIFVEQNEPQKRARHGPLVAAVLKHDDVEHRGQHLLQDLRVHFQDAQEGLVVHHARPALLLLAGQATKQEGDDVVQRSAAACAYHRVCAKERGERLNSYCLAWYQGTAL